jgi:hypothetical protein
MAFSMRYDRFQFLGYDLRPSPASPTNDWGEQRRGDYLIDPTVVRPCSVDEAVWPSLARANDFVGCYQNLWISHERLLESVNNLKVSQSSLTLFAVMKDRRRKFEHAFSPILFSAACQIDPQSIPFSRLDFLGYDIADRWGTSGLVNCKYTNTEIDLKIKHRFATRINRFHLLLDRAEAMRGRRLTELRVREHSPFFVYGIWASLPAYSAEV